jgi:hypothetical protein
VNDTPPEYADFPHGLADRTKTVYAPGPTDPVTEVAADSLMGGPKDESAPPPKSRYTWIS